MDGFHKMRRGDRAIDDFSEILDVLRRADTIRLGLNGDPYPYVVPLSFGFEVIDDAAGSIAVYAHGAVEGFKHELIARDNHVCVEADILHRYVDYGEGDTKSLTAEYESVIGFGAAEAVTGAEAEKGLGLLLDHCGYPNLQFDKAVMDITKIYKFALTAVTGKRRSL